MLQHNLTIAFRNLFKYKLQTTISIVSIAIGIVTMGFVHSILQQYGLPTIYSQPYYERTYMLSFDSIYEGMSRQRYQNLFPTIARTLKADGGLRSVEGMTAGSEYRYTSHFRYMRNDSLLASLLNAFAYTPTDYPSFIGLRSVLTGEVLKPMKPGQAIISQTLARQLFGEESPIGVTFTYGNVPGEEIEYTIVDVYNTPTRCTYWTEQQPMYVCNGTLEDTPAHRLLPAYVMAVLREGFSVQEMECEINQRLEPLGLKVEVRALSVSMEDFVRTSVLTRLVGYVLGFVILLTAVIGFLRLEVQLFWMRRREMALRIVHGAKLRQLYALLMLEIGLMLVASIVLAMAIDAWISDYVLTHMASLLESKDFRGVEPHLGICLAVGAVLLLISAFIVWLTLRRIVRSQQGIAQIMRPSRNHTFRNAMLAVQLAITLFFVCVSFQLTQWASGMCNQYYLPQDDRIYRESIYLNMNRAIDPFTLHDSIMRKQDIAQFIPFEKCWEEIAELSGNKEVKGRMTFGGDIFGVLLQNDMLLSDYLGIKVKWFDRDVDRSRCILVQEDMYRILQECGADNGILTLKFYGRGDMQLPIAGTFDGLTFGRKTVSLNQFNFIATVPPAKEYAYGFRYIAVPKGDYDKVWKELYGIAQRMEPDAAPTIMYNYYEHEASDVVYAETLRFVAWLLGFICLLVSVMGIYSTIALDTRARRKEMAIRKINGAKSKDIAMLFARLYIVIGIAAIATALPTAYLFHETIISYVGTYPGALASPVPPLIYGVAVVFSAILLIVGWHVRGIMRVNPAEIIAKE